VDNYRTYAVDPQTVVGAGFFRDFSLVARSLDKPALTGFFILKCVSPELIQIHFWNREQSFAMEVIPWI
jgi:hypothetical protein